MCERAKERTKYGGVNTKSFYVQSPNSNSILLEMNYIALILQFYTL